MGIQKRLLQQAKLYQASMDRYAKNTAAVPSALTREDIEIYNALNAADEIHYSMAHIRDVRVMSALRRQLRYASLAPRANRHGSIEGQGKVPRRVLWK